MLIGINGGYFPAICRVCFVLQEVDLYMRHFDLNEKVRKAVTVNRFFAEQEKFFDHALRSGNDFGTLKNVFERMMLIDNRFSRFIVHLPIFFVINSRRQPLNGYYLGALNCFSICFTF